MKSPIAKSLMIILLVGALVSTTACVFHASIDTECWYAPEQPPTGASSNSIED